MNNSEASLHHEKCVSCGINDCSDTLCGGSSELELNRFSTIEFQKFEKGLLLQHFHLSTLHVGSTCGVHAGFLDSHGQLPPDGDHLQGTKPFLARFLAHINHQWSDAASKEEASCEDSGHTSPSHLHSSHPSSSPLCLLPQMQTMYVTYLEQVTTDHTLACSLHPDCQSPSPSPLLVLVFM